MITYAERYREGTILKNTKVGVFGQMNGTLVRKFSEEPVEVAFRQEIKTGPAVINESDVNKGMILKVTDPELLELTGGIVQGMSGSPILQNGRLIGAVTHVFVNDPTKGYGGFAESMLEAGE